VSSSENTFKTHVAGSRPPAEPADRGVAQSQHATAPREAGVPGAVLHKKPPSRCAPAGVHGRSFRLEEPHRFSAPLQSGRPLRQDDNRVGAAKQRISQACRPPKRGISSAIEAGRMPPRRTGIALEGLAIDHAAAILIDQLRGRCRRPAQHHPGLVTDRAGERGSPALAAACAVTHRRPSRTIVGTPVERLDMLLELGRRTADLGRRKGGRWGSPRLPDRLDHRGFFRRRVSAGATADEDGSW